MQEGPARGSDYRSAHLDPALIAQETRQLKDTTDLTITSLANTMREEFQAIRIHPTANARVSSFTSTARSSLMDKSQQAPSALDFLKGQELAVALIDAARTTLFTDDTLSQPPLFRLLPSEKPTALIQKVLQAITPSPDWPYNRQLDLLEHAHTTLKQQIVNIALRATTAQDDRKLERDRTATLARSLCFLRSQESPLPQDS